MLTSAAAAQSPVATPAETPSRAGVDLTTSEPAHPLLAELGPAAALAPADSSSLPDAPSATATAPTGGGLSALELMADSTQAGHKYPKTASASDITVLPGQVAPRQTVRDKLVGSVRDSVSPFSLIGEVISGSYTHLTDGSPNFGPGIASYGQRVGSAVARGTSQNLFYEGAMASILHEDPRYYIMGDGKPFFKRVVYAATRPLITRTDGGRTTPNLALLSGYLGAAALTKVYYPPLNQGFNQTLQTFGGSIGGAAIGYLASEFLSDTLQIVHLKKVQ